MKPLLTNKNPMSERIALIDNGKIITDDMETSECFKTSLTNITNPLEIGTVSRYS